MDAHLGYARHEKAPDGARKNRRNGAGTKTLKGTFGEVTVTTPRDSEASFEPQPIQKRQTRLGDFEDKILARYARGLSTRDIESALKDLYGVEVSHDLIARVTDAVLDEVRAWRERPLEAIYPIVWLDGLVLKVRHGKQVVNKRAHIVLGINLAERRKCWASGCRRPRVPSSGRPC